METVEKPLCSIIVPTWNRVDLLAQFVDSLKANTTVPFHLIIIDNNSTDGTCEYLQRFGAQHDDRFTIVFNDDNRGYVGGINQGIALARAAFVCLANNDLLFTKGWLREIISIFNKYDDVGVVNPNSNNFSRYPPKKMSIDEYAQTLYRSFGSILAELTVCIGFCMVIRREVLDKVGNLSTDFHPFFYEDADYSMRVQQAGYRIGVAKGAYVWHHKHASFKGLEQKKEQQFKRSKNIFEKKWGIFLRIAYVMGSDEKLSNVVKKGIEIARQGNYFCIFTKGKTKDRVQLFEECNSVAHGGLTFSSYFNCFDLFWKLVRVGRKKRFDYIVARSWFLQKTLCLCGRRCYSQIDINEVRKLKFHK